MKKLLLCLIVATALFVLPFQSFAQTQDSGIQISPLTYNYEITPGKSQQAKITLKNLSSEPIDYTIETENFTATSEDGAPVFAFGPASEGVTSLADWFDFSGGKTGKLGPKGSGDVEFTISVPEGAEAGGHYAAVFAKVIKKTEEGKTELGVSSRVGTLILVSVPGEITNGVEIEELSIPRWIWKGPVTLGMKVKNTGSIHYDSQADISFNPVLFGNDTKVGMGEHTVLPSSTRDYEGKLNKKYPFGIYKVTATATGGEANPAVRLVTVYAIPLIIVLPLIALIAIIAISMHYIRKKYKIVSK